MSKKKRKELRREDVRTEADKRQYSYQMWERWQNIGEWEPPSAILDFGRFPMETKEWHSPEYWIWAARADEQKARLLKRESRRQLNRMLYKK